MGLKSLAIRQLRGDEDDSDGRTFARTSAAPLIEAARTFGQTPAGQRCAAVADVPPETQQVIARIARVRRWTNADIGVALAAAAVMPDPAEWRALLALVLATPLATDDAEARASASASIDPTPGGWPC